MCVDACPGGHTLQDVLNTCRYLDRGNTLIGFIFIVRLPIYLVKSSPWFPELDLLVVPTAAFQRRVHKSR
ncbi:hypothetical protein WN51_11943 [Melipona quadrifasciata]|uniref:Uncharacterized protein n=1 Tax=Melipona quadrifasciata TaxID=166423 RepID=A0A0M9A586_9HYME|nr:hypothetical protein WN51_11943 [Melipona quadrifasciata]